MFDKDYFTEDAGSAQSQSGAVVGAVGAWGLHIAKVAFLVYSGYHGIAASWTYAGNTLPARLAQSVGIVVLEIVLLSLYLAWHNRRITGAAQSIAAGVTYAIGFILACLAVIADSQLHSGGSLDAWLATYLRWGLPIAPAVMALGALLTHELAPDQLRARKEASARNSFADTQFTAHMANLRAEQDAAKTVRNMQLNAKAAAAAQIAAWYNSEHAQQAITQTAVQNAPSLLRAIGVNIGDIPDANSDGKIDTGDIAAYLSDNPDKAAELFRLARQRDEDEGRAQVVDQPLHAKAVEHANGKPARPTPPQSWRP